MANVSGVWREDEVDGKRVNVFEPGQSVQNGSIVLYLQGYQEESLRNNQLFSVELERHGLRAVCIEGKTCWWTEDICPDFDPTISPVGFIREKVVPYVRVRFRNAVSALAVTGIGFGGQGALQLAYRDPRLFPVVAAIAPAIDFHDWYGRGLGLDDLFANREAARQATATLNIHPLNWPRHQMIVCDPMDVDRYESVERLASKLFSSGIPFESDLQTSNGGHCWRYFEIMAKPVVRFIAERLNQALSYPT